METMMHEVRNNIQCASFIKGDFDCDLAVKWERGFIDPIYMEGIFSENIDEWGHSMKIIKPLFLVHEEFEGILWDQISDRLHVDIASKLLRIDPFENDVMFSGALYTLIKNSLEHCQ